MPDMALACGLVDPNEVDDLYVAVLMVSATLDGIASDRASQVLSIARDHARDAPGTPQICQEVETALPKLRGLLGPMLAAKKSTR
jgi:hypothetical protein